MLWSVLRIFSFTVILINCTLSKNHTKKHWKRSRAINSNTLLGNRTSTDGNGLPTATDASEFYYLTKKKIHLEQTERNLADSKFHLDNALASLENLCQTEQAQEKIAFLAANFLHKNLKIAQEYEAAKKLVSDLSEKLQVAEKRFKALNSNYSGRNKNFVYRVIQPVSHSTKTSPLTENELTSIIADALMGEPYAVQLVARSDGNNLEIEKDWNLMSELDKDEIINKKIIREL